jgi:methylase of polypeptide subunit release factors
VVRTRLCDHPGRLPEGVGTDVDARAVRCAQDNAKALGLAARFNATRADLFIPDVRFDRILFNAPWMPGKPATRLDHAPRTSVSFYLHSLPHRLDFRTI